MTKIHPFITHLESLRDDRAALAALRRGLGQPPGTVASMHRYVVYWLPPDEPWLERAYYLVAALFAYHPAEGGKGNMGNHFARTRDPQGDNTAIERRFTALLAAHPDDLDFYLRQAISFIKSKDEVPINWHQLLSDVLAWSHPDRYVQKDWARAFWGRPTKE
jgi:CRISPR system Cascade subunit CasB